MLFDQASPTLAFLKPQLQIFGGVMQDCLNLAFVDGQWRVVAKLGEKVAADLEATPVRAGATGAGWRS
ncbi:hypothetical protein BJ978_002988 [Agromyces terreus]|uniref:Uncharacterized protein n=1 Tax=Agromyces terreus TaxID=424795 RepID=A0A9X2KFZ8_9MICO|nr:hypothetical protein [Agromyces terreus]MCP2372312.1 hypothetical protein [Agromyces terreus]